MGGRITAEDVEGVQQDLTELRNEMKPIDIAISPNASFISAITLDCRKTCGNIICIAGEFKIIAPIKPHQILFSNLPAPSKDIRYQGSIIEFGTTKAYSLHHSQ